MGYFARRMSLTARLTLSGTLRGGNPHGIGNLIYSLLYVRLITFHYTFQNVLCLIFYLRMLLSLRDTTWGMSLKTCNQKIENTTDFETFSSPD